MKETGIIMSGNHPELIIKGDKTMTRRTYGLEFVNQNPDGVEFIRMEGDLAVFHKKAGAQYTLKHPRPKIIEASLGAPPGVPEDVYFYIKCPYGQVGDWLWVKETWKYYNCSDLIAYKADGDLQGRWKSPRFMPKKYARIWREITGLGAGRLQDITAGDVLREGITSEGMSWDWIQDRGQREGRNFSGLPPLEYAEEWYIRQFAKLWDSLNKKYPWAMNPWVWVPSFKSI